MRKYLRIVLPALLVPVAAVGFSGTAQASITSTCNTLYGGDQICGAMETMGSGDCEATIEQTDTTFVTLSFVDQDSGYDCRFWLERDVNGTGWYDESGQITEPDNRGGSTGNYWDGSGYEARGCFEFLWSGTSDPGAVHCSPALGNYA